MSEPQTYLIFFNTKVCEEMCVSVLIHNPSAKDKVLLDYIETNQPLCSTKWDESMMNALCDKIGFKDYKKKAWLQEEVEYEEEGFDPDASIPYQHCHGVFIPFYRGPLHRYLVVEIPDWGSAHMVE